MEEEQRRAELSVKKFSYALKDVDKSIRPLLSALETLRNSTGEEELDPLSRARLHITLCYTMNSLFVMYLRTQGMDPLSHPVSDEILRVQEAFMRLRKVEAGISTDYKPPADRDRRKHIVNAKKAAAVLASAVLPEEAELFAALQGNNKRKRDSDSEGSEDENASNEDEGKNVPKKAKVNNGAENGEDVLEEPKKDEEVSKKKKKKDKKERKNKKAKSEQISLEMNGDEEKSNKDDDDNNAADSKDEDAREVKEKKKKKKKDKKKRKSS